MTLDPRLIASFGVAIGFEVMFPLVVGYLIHRHYQVSWRFFLYGALVFFVSQLLTRIPLTQVIPALLPKSLQALPLFLLVWNVVLAVTAGLFEEGGRYLGYRYLVRDNKTWQVGLMYGAGHGGLESIVLVGGLTLLGLLQILALPAADLPQVAQIPWWIPLLGAYERFVTLFFQIALSILVLQVFLRHSRVWLVLAIALHAVVDLTAVLLAAQVGGVGTEVALTLLLPLSLYIIYYFRPMSSPAPQVVVATV